MAIADCHLCDRKRWDKGGLRCCKGRADIVEMQVRGCPLGVFGPGGAAGLGRPAEIPAEYEPTPAGAIEGGCGCKK